MWAASRFEVGAPSIVFDANMSDVDSAWDIPDFTTPLRRWYSAAAA